MMITTTLFKYIQSELMQAGKNEIIEKDESKFFDPPLDFLWFDEEKQFINKILKYDEDVEEIVNNLFAGLTLDNEEYDHHFKKNFVNRFANRQINRQTIEAFQMELVSTFLSYEDFLNRMYEDVELFITQAQESEQKNKQVNDGTSTTDNRSAFADLPQSDTNLDVDNTTMDYATDNTVSRNREKNQQETDGTTTGKNKKYSLDELFKANGLFEDMFNVFDKKCFLQVW